MCRWFAYFSKEEPCLLEDALIIPEHAIPKQTSKHVLPWTKRPSEDDATVGAAGNREWFDIENTLVNTDGLGVAWYTNTETSFNSPFTKESEAMPMPVVYKTLANPLNDSNFKSICRGTAANTVLCHIRMAVGSAVHEYNCHPFTFGRYTLMFNGFIGDFDYVKKKMIARMSDAAYRNVRGSTDTEHFVNLYATLLAEVSTTHGGPAGAASWFHSFPPAVLAEVLEKTITMIFNYQRDYIVSLPDKRKIDPRTGKPREPEESALNVCITDGMQLLGMRYRSHATLVPLSLCYTETAGFALNRKYPGTAENPGATTGPTSATLPKREHKWHLIIASEPSTKDDFATVWHEIPRNTLVYSEVVGGNYKVTGPLPVKVDFKKELGM